MNPMLLASLISGGTSLLGGLMNQDPYEKMLEEIKNLTSASALNNSTQNIYKNWLGSGAFGAAKGANMSAANTTRSQLASRLGQSGLGLSGVGQAASSLASSSYGPAMSQLYSSGWNNASQMAQQLMQMRLQGLGFAGRPQNTGGTLLGSGLGALGEILKWYMQKHGYQLPAASAPEVQFPGANK